MRRPRRLSQAEIELWVQVARTVTPRAGSLLPATPEKAADPPAAGPPAEAPPPPPPRPTAPSYAPPVGSPPKLPPLAPIERRLKRRIAGGRIGIEAVLDLHGMTQAAAHDALTHFLLRAHAAGHRLVVVITGKGSFARDGGDSGRESGVLRRAVPHWLRDPRLRGMVLGYEEASAAHGGAGALYVRLRRREAADH